MHIIWLCKHPDIKFESKNQFRKYIKNCQKISKVLHILMFRIEDLATLMLNLRLYCLSFHPRQIGIPRWVEKRMIQEMENFSKEISWNTVALLIGMSVWHSSWLASGRRLATTLMAILGPFWIFEALTEGMIESKNLLIGWSDNLRFDLFPDPIGHFWIKQTVRCCRQCGVAGSGRVPPAPLG